jgi:hypothetical protein
MRYLESKLSQTDPDDARWREDLSAIRHLEQGLLRITYGADVVAHAETRIMDALATVENLRVHEQSSEDLVRQALDEYHNGSSAAVQSLLEYVLFLIAEDTKYIECGHPYGQTPDGYRARKQEVENQICARKDLDQFTAEVRLAWATLQS